MNCAITYLQTEHSTTLSQPTLSTARLDRCRCCFSTLQLAAPLMRSSRFIAHRHEATTMHGGPTSRMLVTKPNSGSFSSSMQTFNGPQKKSRKLADTTILARTTRPAKITILAATSRSSVLDLILWLCRNAKQVLHHAEANTFGSAAPLELCIT